MSIVEALTIARKAHRRTQQSLAESAGLSRMTVQRIEAGEIDARLSTILEMSRALGMELVLVPAGLRAEVESFVQTGGRVLGQPAGAGAPPSVVELLDLPGAPRGTRT